MLESSHHPFLFPPFSPLHFPFCLSRIFSFSFSPQYVCVCVCLRTRMRVCACVGVWVGGFGCGFVGVGVCVCLRMYMFAPRFISDPETALHCESKHTRTYPHTHIDTCKHVCVHSRTQTYISLHVDFIHSPARAMTRLFVWHDSSVRVA